MSSCPTGFIRISDYHDQAIGLPIKNGYQMNLLNTTDCITKVREGTKVGTVASIVSGAVCYALKLNPAIALPAIVTCGVSWSVSTCCAHYCEPEAKKLIRNLKEDKIDEEGSNPPQTFYSPYSEN